MTEEAKTEPDNKKGKKAPPANLVIPPKKPKPTKAERRQLQEAQRAAKAKTQEGQPIPSQQTVKQKPQEAKQDSGPRQPSLQPPKQQQENTSGKHLDAAATKVKTLELFSHLPRHKGTCWKSQ